MKLKTILAAMMAAMLCNAVVLSADDGTSFRKGKTRSSEYRDILRFQENGMHGRAGILFDEMYRNSGIEGHRGASVLSDVCLNVQGYEYAMWNFINENPHSVLVPTLRYRHAINLFDKQEYIAAGEQFDAVSPVQIEKSQLDEYLFKKAYCELERGDLDKALLRFIELEKRPVSDYTAPSKYSIAYINYKQKHFQEALAWFERASTDSRFKDISSYYIMECRFMLKDYRYVTTYGGEMYDKVPEDRKPHLARILSESWLVLGDPVKAREYYELTISPEGETKTRTDWFYSGSVLYAVEDYKGAIESYNNMGVRADSLGQVANYHLGFSYVQTRNKVAALDAFKDAAMSTFDLAVAEDAHFNWAKLAFDINNDSSVFQDYMRRYSDRAKDERIYSYMAVAALHNRDYAGAVDAYGMIDELDPDMKNNYMKANYLRAEQLVSAGSYRMAIPCLKIAAYYSDRGSRFNQLARFWLAESYYRNDQYEMARETFNELYNQSALFRQPESYLLPYNIAYCYFKEEDYSSAVKWFRYYLNSSSVEFKKEALVRIGDCYFITRDYKNASASYDAVVNEFFDVNDIYPYYQSAVSYGLSGNTTRKIKLLSSVLDADPESEFYPEALLELGRAYVVKEDDANAYRCFNRLAESVKDTSFVARAYIEMGSLSRNQSQFNEALGYYRTVVEEMPLSGYAEDALAAIESIYQTKNEPEEYIRYIESIGKGASKSEDEKEDMIFNSAEQVYITENYHKALASLQSYLETYPDGRYVYRAYFYMADSYRQLGKLEQACDYYKQVIEGGSGSYVELSMLSFADISYKLERWDDAFGGYSSLYSSARFENNKLAALSGMMRSAYKGHKWEEAVKNADKVLFDSRIGEDVKREAEYIKAKSYLATSRRSEALVIMEKLAADLKDGYGAEAAYMLILDSYDKAEFSDVENKVYAFSDAASPQTYWLAKSFIVLGDAFADRGEYTQAKATFESVRDGYKPVSSDDDVLDNVRMRLDKLQEIMASNNR